MKSFDCRSFKTVKLVYVCFITICVFMVVVWFSYVISNKLESDMFKGSKNVLKTDYMFEKQHNDEIKNIFAEKKVGASFEISNMFVGQKLVHIDLKGAPFKPSYYKKLFPLLSTLGATGILIEYEDMFPYSGHLKNLSAYNAYTHDDVREINNQAKQHNLSVIPLIQTFDHLEFMLKLEEFTLLREMPEFPSSICPSNKLTFVLLKEMIFQQIEAHSASNLIHISAGEVSFLGVCDKCNQVMKSNHLTKDELYLKHVSSLTSVIKEKYPNIRILIWDDVLRSLQLTTIVDNIDKSVVPVIQTYVKDVYNELDPALWEMYSQIFPTVWIASAFKGVSGSSNYVPDVSYYTENHRSWMSVYNEYKSQLNFEGIIISGFQRYDHFSILCELLPVSLPTLAMSLEILNNSDNGPFYLLETISKSLKCERHYGLMGATFGSPKCSYPGGDILDNILQFHHLTLELDELLSHQKMKGWMNEYNIKHTFSNCRYVLDISASLQKIYNDMLEINSNMRKALGEVYDDHTVEEWMETYFWPFKKKLFMLVDGKNKILEKKVWPRRPLKINDES